MKGIFLRLFLILFVGAFFGSTVWAETDLIQAENAFFRGSHLLTKDNFSEAISALEKAVKLDPENLKYRNVLAVAYNNWGLRLNKSGDYREGINYLIKALTLSGEDKEIIQNYVQSVQEAVVLPEDRLSEEEKISMLTKLMEIEPENAAAKHMLAAILNNSAVNQGKSGNPAEEADRLEKAAGLDPNNLKIKKNLSTAYLNLAARKAKEGDVESEVQLIRQALKLNPKDQTINENLGKALGALAVKKGHDGDTAAQITLLKDALTQAPNDQALKTNLAAAYNNHAVAQSGLDFGERIATLESALKIDPKNRSTLTNISSLLVKEAVRDSKSGNNAKAIELLERAMKLDPAGKIA